MVKIIDLDTVPNLKQKIHADYIVSDNDILIIIEEARNPKINDVEQVISTKSMILSNKDRFYLIRILLEA